MNSARMLLFLAATLALTACSGAPSWLEGNWQVDHDRTQKDIDAANSNATSSQTGFGGGLLSGLNTMLGNMLLPQLAGMQIIITGKDQVTMINGQGKSESYEVVNRSSDQCTLKLKDDSVQTYYRDGDEIYMYPTGGAHFKIYLMRQP